MPHKKRGDYGYRQRALIENKWGKPERVKKVAAIKGRDVGPTIDSDEQSIVVWIHETNGSKTTLRLRWDHTPRIVPLHDNIEEVYTRISRFEEGNVFLKVGTEDMRWGVDQDETPEGNICRAMWAFFSSINAVREEDYETLCDTVFKAFFQKLHLEAEIVTLAKYMGQHERPELVFNFATRTVTCMRMGLLILLETKRFNKDKDHVEICIHDKMDSSRCLMLKVMRFDEEVLEFKVSHNATRKSLTGAIKDFGLNDVVKGQVFKDALHFHWNNGYVSECVVRIIDILSIFFDYSTEKVVFRGCRLPYAGGVIYGTRHRATQDLMEKLLAVHSLQHFVRVEVDPDNVNFIMIGTEPYDMSSENFEVLNKIMVNFAYPMDERLDFEVPIPITIKDEDLLFTGLDAQFLFMRNKNSYVRFARTNAEMLTECSTIAQSDEILSATAPAVAPAVAPTVAPAAVSVESGDNVPGGPPEMLTDEEEDNPLTPRYGETDYRMKMILSCSTQPEVKELLLRDGEDISRLQSDLKILQEELESRKEQAETECVTLKKEVRYLKESIVSIKAASSLVQEEEKARHEKTERDSKKLLEKTMKKIHMKDQKIREADEMLALTSREYKKLQEEHQKDLRLLRLKDEEIERRGREIEARDEKIYTITKFQLELGLEKTPPKNTPPKKNRKVELAEVEEQLAKEHDSFLCPITLSLLRDPVVAADGHTYERTDMEGHITWQKEHGSEVRSPKTNERLKHLHLTPNHTMRATIADAIDALRGRMEAE